MIVVLKDGAFACACGSPIIAETVPADIWTTHRLPPDVKNAASFHRVCRSGRVKGATKDGRVWSCPCEAWAARAKPVPPVLTDEQRKAARAKRLAKAAARADLPVVSDDVLREWGGQRVKRVG